MGLFGILKSIPIVGPVVKVTTSTALLVGCAATGNMDEFADAHKQLGLGMDIANLNPLKAANNMANGIVANTGGLKRGVWLGKRPLGFSPLSLTFTPGTSLAHWAILFNGTLYHCTGKDSSGYCKIEITDDKDEIDSFTWNFLAGNDDVRLTSSEIRKYAESFRTQKYSLLSTSETADNCQWFVLQMLHHCTHFSEPKCVQMLVTLGGSTLLF